MTYDKTYSLTENVFGKDPEKTLEKFYNLINPNYPILDIGVGQGRNSFFLGERGFNVDCIDTSKVSTSFVKEKGIEENISLKVYQSSFQSFLPAKVPYSAILIFGLFQILNRDSIKMLINKINQWTTEGSLIFISAFSIDDESYIKYGKEWQKLDNNSFTDNRNNFRTFFNHGEIQSFFPSYKVLYQYDGLGPKHRHGNSPIEQHAMIDLVLKR